MSRTTALRAAGASALLAIISALSPSADAEAPQRPTFTKDVMPILQENCQECHRPKPISMSGLLAPFSLMSYEEARPWAKAIAKVVQTKEMPPWFATDEFDGHFRNERGLEQDEIDTIVRWVEQGARRGNPKDAPEPIEFEDAEWWIGEPDLIVPLPEPVWVGDEVEDWQPNIEIELTEEMLPEDRWIHALEAQADSDPVHHIVVYKVGPDQRSRGIGGQHIGGLAPGAEPSLLQDGYGIKLEKGSTLRVSMHYHKESGPGTGVYDQSRLGFHFYDHAENVKQIEIAPVGSTDFVIPPNHPNYTVSMARTFTKPFTVLNYLPHMHFRGKAAKYWAVFPDGTREKLLDVPRYDYDWQLFYEYPEPRKFPAGTRIEVELTYDNSANNPSNPDPNRAVPFGLETTDEMAFGWMYYSYEDASSPGAADD